jgi:hypothetical protein
MRSQKRPTDEIGMRRKPSFYFSRWSFVVGRQRFRGGMPSAVPSQPRQTWVLATEAMTNDDRRSMNDDG